MYSDTLLLKTILFPAYLQRRSAPNILFLSE